MSVEKDAFEIIRLLCVRFDDKEERREMTGCVESILERVAKRERAVEREACVAVLDRISADRGDSDDGLSVALQAIRARGARP